MSREEILAILRTFKQECAEKYGITTLGLFGSAARDENRTDSDVDVVIKTKTPDPYNLVHVKEEREKQLHLKIDLVRLRERMNPFLKNRIEKEAVYV
jgi:predicted nucleotidyltransferase